MVFFNLSPLCDQEPSTSDDTVFIKDLPDRGYLSGIDLKFGATNIAHAAGSAGKNILDAINKLEIVLNGDIRLFSMTGHELFQHMWAKNGKPPYYAFNERNGAESFIHFPIRFGRYLGDPQFGLNLGNWRNAQLLIDYTLPVGDASDGNPTGFATGTTKISAMMHITPPEKSAPFRACIGTRQFYTHASTANEVKRMPLPLQNPIIGVGMYNHLAATAQGDTVLKYNLEFNNGDRVPLRGRWDDHVRIQSERIVDTPLRFLTNVTEARTLDLLTSYIHNAQVRPATAEVASAAAGKFYHTPSFSVAGGLLTWGKGSTLTATVTTGAVTRDELDDNTPMDLIVSSFPDRYIYWPMGDPMTMEDIINPGTYNKIEAVVEEGATGGATESLIVEELRPA